MLGVGAREAIVSELRGLRRHPSGVSIETLAHAPVICRLLGNGDPYLAYTRLQHGLIDATADRPLRAAAASLGFSVGGATHLERLDKAGADLGLDQRQVRRLSDQGLIVLATLISTNWIVEAVPSLGAVVTAGLSHFDIAVTTRRPLIVEMSEPEIELLVSERSEVPVITWRTRDHGDSHFAVGAPMRIERAGSETSLMIVWRGEVWPKFTVHWHGGGADFSSESLGNKLMLRLVLPAE
jgi:hypothetical protein